MNSVAPKSLFSAWNDDTQVLEEVRKVSREQLAPAAESIDKGRYPLEIMSSLGKAGAFAVHLDKHGERFGLALSNMHEISRQCGSTGFMTWCHDVCGLYMEQSGNPALLARLDDHVVGKTFGGTALSNPMKALTGIEAMALKAIPAENGGYRVSGTLPWVSHIQRGHYCGAVAAVDLSNGQRSHEVMFMLDLDDRVKLKQCPEFSGMEGTSTWSIQLRDYLVTPEQIIADPVRPFIQRIRGAFVMLQAGMATGVAQGAIDSIREVELSLGHVNQYLHLQPDELQAELDELRSRMTTLATTPYETDKSFLIDVLDARAQGSELALKATQSALLHQGARGYLMSAPPQRRIREAHFVAIVTPALKHLRWEIAKLMKEEMPS
ncbi:acyl-CoA/acyl-ACP dehydrogenase [Halomonas sp. MC140]|nr:acyl-CoA dehydrogenase family protein [Halomonas sp. MC140]MDN7130934.1 acyl-CoA/acyl-ACP dehydrogenase [Halomonas sp. MC140]